MLAPESEITEIENVFNHVYLSFCLQQGVPEKPPNNAPNNALPWQEWTLGKWTVRIPLEMPSCFP